jgi:nitroreductase
MCRSFSPHPVAPAVIDRILREALRSPTAGNTAGTAWVVLEGSAQTSFYWDATTDDDWRAANPAWASGLMRAPVVLLSYTSPGAYLARYSEADKAASGLGSSQSAWPVPYWYGDAAFGVMTVLLAAVDAGLGACTLGNFRGEERLASSLGVPGGWRLFAAVALGHPDGRAHRSASLDRHVPAPATRIHRGAW